MEKHPTFSTTFPAQLKRLKTKKNPNKPMTHSNNDELKTLEDLFTGQEKQSFPSQASIAKEISSKKAKERFQGVKG